MLIIRHHIIVGQHSMDLFSPFLLLNICEFFFTDEKNFSLNYHKVGTHEPYILFGIFLECSIMEYYSRMFQKAPKSLKCSRIYQNVSYVREYSRKFYNAPECSRIFHRFEYILEISIIFQNVPQVQEYSRNIYNALECNIGSFNAIFLN